MSNGGWTDDGTVVRLTTSSDQVGVGTATPATTLRMEVEGRARLTLEDKGGEVFDVMAYGAKGDGTGDDAAAVNAAITAAPSGGGVVYFPAGTYRLDSTISFGKPLMFIGAGSNMTVIKSRANSHGFFAPAFSFQFTFTNGDERVQPVVFRDMRLQFDTDQATPPGFDNTSILIQQVPGSLFFHGFRFEDCLFRKYHVGIKLDGNSTAVIENCIFWSLRASYADVWLADTVGGDSSTNMFRNCVFADAPPQATYGILIEGQCGGETITGSLFIGYEDAVRIAVPVYPNSANIIIGNQMEGARAATIHFAKNSYNSIIAQNDLAPGAASAYCIKIDPDGGTGLDPFR